MSGAVGAGQNQAPTQPAQRKASGAVGQNPPQTQPAQREASGGVGPGVCVRGAWECVGMDEERGPERGRRVADGREVTMVTSLDVGQASAGEMLAELRHLLDVYTNDVVVSGAEPYWLYRQRWKRRERDVAPSEYPVEFLDWLVAHTFARMELAERGAEPVDDLPMAYLAQVLLAELTESPDAAEMLLAEMSRVEVMQGFVFLGAVIASLKDELHAG